MKKLLIAGLMLVVSVSASNHKKQNPLLVNQVTIPSGVDSLNRASQNLQLSTERLNASLSKIK
jgi:hypothetical protein